MGRETFPQPLGPAARHRLGSLHPALVASIGLAIVLAWTCLHITYRYNSNWTSLFYTGEQFTMPEELRSENIYRFPKVIGYDGQLYHLIAHDLLFTRGFDRYLDFPRLRYRRVLVSAIAALLSFGHSAWVDPAYIGTVFGFAFLGTLWLAKWSAYRGRSTLWGLLFLVTPAALVSLLMMTIDVALAALTVGFLWYVEQRSPVKLFVVLACAALARETGILLLLGWCGWLILDRQWRRAAFYSLAALPLLSWVFFVNLRTTPGSDQWLSPIPFSGIVGALINPFRYPNQSRMADLLLTGLSQLALIGMLFAIALVIRDCAERRNWSPRTFAAAAFALLAIFLGNGLVWPEVSAFGRNFTPLFLMVGMSVMDLRKSLWGWLPMAIVVPRIAVIYLHHTIEIIRSMVLIGR